MVYKNQLYLAGWKITDDERRATLWIGNLDGSAFSTTNLSKTESDAFDLNVLNDVIYTCGYNAEASGVATIWKLNLNSSNISSFNLSNSSSAYSFTFFNNSILTVGRSKADQATLWNTSLDGINLTSPTRLGSLTYESEADSIAINSSSFPTLGRSISRFSGVNSQKGVK